MGIQPVVTPAETIGMSGLTAASPAPADSRAADLGRDTLRTSGAEETREKTLSTDPEELQRALQDAVKRANEAVHLLRSNLKFTVDESTGIRVVKFIDVATREVIRQIPSEEMLALARRLDEVTGLLIKEKA